MTEFVLSHRADEAIDLVNGSYTVDPLASCPVEGREIVYATANACLDNSCCGQLDVSYVIVYGERISGDSGGEGGLLIRSIDDERYAEAVKRELTRREGAQVINFYTPPASALA